MLKFSFRNQVLAGFAMSIVLVFVVAVLSYKSIQKLEADGTKVQHTHLGYNGKFKLNTIVN